MSQSANFMQRVGFSRCVRCDFTTEGIADFRDQDAAMHRHLDEKHPGWMTETATMDGQHSNRTQPAPEQELREQAIKDVAEALGHTPEAIRYVVVKGGYSDLSRFSGRCDWQYVVAQREAVLEREAECRDLRAMSSHAVVKIEEARNRIAELEALAPRWRSQAQGESHWDDCWKEHRQCALDRIAKLEGEIAQWKTWGVVEIAIRNPNFAEYCKHWEMRAAELQRQLAEARRR